MSKPGLGDVKLQELRRAAGGAAPVEQPALARRYPQPGRLTKVPLTGFFEKPVRKQMWEICTEHERTIQDLLREAINDLFAKYGKPEIAE